MPKVQIKRKSLHIDMTAMTDVAFLLLTFFMLTTKFKPEEPFVVDTPASVADVKLPDANLIQISIDKDAHVFFGISGQKIRVEMLKQMGIKYKVNFTNQEAAEFSLVESFGIPIAQLPGYLDMKAELRTKIRQPGIPTDTIHNQLRDWIHCGRVANQQINKKSAFVAIKGDRDADYPIVKRVIEILQDQKVNKFNFITSLKTEE